MSLIRNVLEIVVLLSLLYRQICCCFYTVVLMDKAVTEQGTY